MSLTEFSNGIFNRMAIMFLSASKWADAKIIHELPQTLNTKLGSKDKDGR